MFERIVYSIFPLVLFCACTPVSGIVAEEEGRVILSLDIEEPGGKASGYLDEHPEERKVSSVRYYVFDASGRLEAVFGTSSVEAVSRTVSTGDKTVWAAVNIPESRFSGCTTLAGFESQEVSFEDIGAGGFPMAGKTSLHVGTGNCPASITARRFVSRVCLASVTNQLSGVWDGEDLNIRAVYVSNAVGNCKITGESPSTLLWYNRAGRTETGGEHDFIVKAEDASFPGTASCDLEYAPILWNTSESPYACVYFFPNPTQVDHKGWAPAFTERFTRIVVAVDFARKTYFYPVTIEGAVRNNAYTLHLTLTHPGAVDPESPDYDTSQGVLFDVDGFEVDGYDLDISF